MRTACLLSVLACSLVSCAEPGPSSYPLAIRVESDPGIPLAGARILAGGKLLGESDGKAPLSIVLHGKPGETVSLESQCPAGHRNPEKPLSVLLRAQNGRDEHPEYQLSCAPLLRTVVLSVRSQNGPNLPLRYLGREIARTDESGAAHAQLIAAPGETLTVTLDTSAPEQRALMPQNPELKIVVPEHDEVVVFDQAFTLPAVKAVRKPRPPKGPQRI